MKRFYSIITIVSIILILFSIFYIGLNNLAGKILLAMSAGFLVPNLSKLILSARKAQK